MKLQIFMANEANEKIEMFVVCTAYLLKESSNIDKCVCDICIYAAMQQFIHSNGQKLRVKQTQQLPN